MLSKAKMGGAAEEAVRDAATNLFFLTRLTRTLRAGPMEHPATPQRRAPSTPRHTRRCNTTDARAQPRELRPKPARGRLRCPAAVQWVPRALPPGGGPQSQPSCSPRGPHAQGPQRHVAVGSIRGPWTASLGRCLTQGLTERGERGGKGEHPRTGSSGKRRSVLALF